MEASLTWIAYGLAGVFFAACVVAWYEHLGRAEGRHPVADWESPLPRALTVDIDLEALAAPAGGDVDERRAALGGAISRMAGGRRRGRSFGDTVPMILSGPRVPAAAEQHDSAAAG
jgi:hypothetical protein